MSQESRAAGYLGLLPFVASLALALSANAGGVAGWSAAETRAYAEQLGLSWGAIILTFVGAVHWGLTVAGACAWQPKSVLTAITPSVVALLGLWLGGIQGYSIIIAGLGFFWLYEHRYCTGFLPADYVQLRRVLTLSVCTLLALTAIALDVGSQ
jgi:hypothetical protein